MIRYLGYCGLVCLIAAGCARNAPELPQDRSSVNAVNGLTKHDFLERDLAMDCAAIVSENKSIRAEADKYNATIQGNRQNNQVAGYIAGVLFLPAALATEQNTAEKARLDKLQHRFDTLQKLKRFRSCSS